jgi:Cu(I)/Ag(I) efflux system membrane protein CusA/SilA
MLKAVIEFSIRNAFAVLVGTVLVAAAGIWAMRNIPLDAIPDLSDTQAIIYTEWPGQNPQVIQDQVTYPIAARMLSVPRAKVVRSYSFFGFSLVYVIFDDGTDPYWARSRVLEYLNGLSGTLPPNVTPSLGPDATGVGWAFIYSLNSKTRDLASLRSVQDWHLRYALSSVEGVAEVASVGGFVRQYQVVVDPLRLRAARLSLGDVAKAVGRSSGEVGGRSIEMAEKEFMISVPAYVSTLDDLRKVAVGSGADGTPILLGDVADVRLGADMRRGIAELNGEGETVGGIVVVRYGADVRRVISAVKERLAEAMKSLPPDVSVTVAYDRTALIDRAVRTLEAKLVEESVVVALVCLAFLFHVRSALVAILVLPVGVLASFAIMYGQGLSSNIMSLGGIAIAIGAMVDAAIVMIENAHKHAERDGGSKPHRDIIRDASVEVGPTLFYSLLVITVSFLPVFTLQEQEGRLFRPLAFTKTWSMAAAALLSVTLAPVLMRFFVRGRIPREEANPLNRLLIRAYRPVLDFVVRWRRTAVVLGIAAVASAWLPLSRLGSEFMPPLDEGDLLYMPTTLPGISPTKARELLQQTDRIIRSFPEVRQVFGKIGRAETATDPAPLEMIETSIQLRPESEWPAVDIPAADGRPAAHRRRTRPELVDAMNAALSFPGLSNAWTMPIRNRIDMLATGIKTPVGIKLSGTNLADLDRVSGEIEAVVRGVPGTGSVFGERVMAGNYVNIDIDRGAIARVGLTVGDVQDVVGAALGGMPLATTVDGLERYAITLRYDRDFRGDLGAIRDLAVPLKSGAQVPLGRLATVKVVSAPMAIRSEGAEPGAWIYVDPKGSDIGSYVKAAQSAVERAIAAGTVRVPQGMGIRWSGQFEYMQRAQARLRIVIPFTLLLIVLILYLNMRSLPKVAIVLLAVPFSLVGAFWFLHILDYNLSVAVGVGLIALAGLDAETGVVMLLYLDLAHERRLREGRLNNEADLSEAVSEGAVQRIRPKIMTVCAILFGLLPIMASPAGEAGADLMKRIAAPMIGGVVTSAIMELLLYPAIYMLWKGRRLTSARRQ